MKKIKWDVFRSRGLEYWDGSVDNFCYNIAIVGHRLNGGGVGVVFAGICPNEVFESIDIAKKKIETLFEEKYPEEEKMEEKYFEHLFFVKKFIEAEGVE